jgi:mutator protein MutT
MAFRPPDRKKPLMWEYPGGKVEAEESLPQALKRELKEELDIDVVVGERIAKTIFLWKENIELYLFAIESWTGEPKPLVATELKWVDPEYAVDHMPCLPGSFAVYREVIAYLKRLP